MDFYCYFSSKMAAIGSCRIVNVLSYETQVLLILSAPTMFFTLEFMFRDSDNSVPMMPRSNLRHQVKKKQKNKLSTHKYLHNKETTIIHTKALPHSTSATCTVPQNPCYGHQTTWCNIWLQTTARQAIGVSIYRQSFGALQWLLKVTPKQFWTYISLVNVQLHI